MEKIGQAALMFGVLYLMIFLFVLMGSRTFFSRRTIISNPAAVAGVLWVIAVLALFWNAFWGRNAGIAFCRPADSRGDSDRWPDQMA
jgi:hypothetical protein